MANIVAVEAGRTGEILCATWARTGGHSTSAAPQDVSDADVVLFGGADPSVLTRSGSLRDGAVVIDCGNIGGLADLRAGGSRAELLAKALLSARVVKALNTITSDALDAVAQHGTSAMDGVYVSGFYCGDDDDAKHIVSGLMGEVGLDPIDCGKLADAVLLEGLGLLVNQLAATATPPLFAVTIARSKADRSPLDPWM